MSPQVFTIPGLGFTPEVFSRLELGAPVEHLSWLRPAADESLSAYAGRFADELPVAGGSPIVLVGHSFGGVLAQEIAARRPVERVVLISSMKSRAEIPPSLRAVAPLGLHRLFGRRITLATFALWGPAFGYATVEEQELFRRMVGGQDDATLRWQLRELSTWKGVDLRDTPVDHLHGDRDRTLPISRIAEPVHRLPGGTHLMVHGRAEEVSAFVRGCLERCEAEQSTQASP